MYGGFSKGKVLSKIDADGYTAEIVEVTENEMRELLKIAKVLGEAIVIGGAQYRLKAD